MPKSYYVHSYKIPALYRIIIKKNSSNRPLVIIKISPRLRIQPRGGIKIFYRSNLKSETFDQLIIGIIRNRDFQIWISFHGTFNCKHSPLVASPAPA